MKYAKRYSFLGIALLMFSLFAVPASSNSAQMKWEGTYAILYD